MWAALRHRDFRRLSAAAAVSQVGDWLYNVALAVYAYEQTHSAAWIGALTLFRLIPYVLLAPVGGVLADRYERRRVLIVSDVLRTGLMAIMAIAVAANTPVLAVGLLACLTTAAGTAYFPATLALLPELLDEDELASGNSITAVVQSAAIVIGPAIGGVLLAVATPTWSFVANAATFALGALLMTTVRTRRASRADERAADDAPIAQFVKELAGGVEVLREFPVVRVLTSLAVGASFIYGIQTVVLVILAGERIGHSASSVGFLYGALGLGGLIGAPIATRLARQPRLGTISLVALIGAAVPVALLIPVHNAPAAFVLVVCSGIGQMIVDVLSITALQRSVDNEVTGRVFGLFDALTVGAMIAGSLLVAPLRSALGFGEMLVVVAVLGPVLVIAQFRSLLDGDRDALIPWSRQKRAIDDLRRVTLFANLRESALERLARGAVRERFAVGDVIILEGTPAKSCYSVLHGSVAVRRGDADGPVVATLHEDDHFGEIGLLHDVTRTATVTAATDCVLYMIDADTFRGALEADSLVAGQAFEAAGARLAALRSAS